MIEQGSEPQEEAPLLEKLRSEIAIAETFLSKENPSPHPAGLIVRRFRASLSKFYGKDSPLLGEFHELPVFPIQANVHNYLRTHLPLMRSVVASLEVAVLHGATRGGGRIFLGHGRSPIWREFKDFLEKRLGLPWDEFNREPVAGYATSERLDQMLDAASFAFLIMTAEEEHANDMLHARPNVIHEAGLFQGRLGMKRAIILLEEGCAEFSNIVGLSQIRFPRNHISACFEEVRRVLERESLL
jgi:hypothetical protein